MGAREQDELDLIRGAGGKDGSSAHTPIEDPNTAHSTQYARVIDVLAEGELEGPADPTHPLRCVYFDKTPIENPSGTTNFTRLVIDIRNGTQSQPYLLGFPAAENEQAAGQEVKQAVPIVHTITDPAVTAVRVTLGFPQMTELNISTGDLHGSSVRFGVDMQNGSGGGYVEQFTRTLTIKVTTMLLQSYRVELTGPPPWNIRVRRISPDSTSSVIVNKFIWSSYTEIIDGKLRYPNTGLIGVQIDASQFSSIPTRAYDWKGLRIKVPVNYDPGTRVYTGSWDGTFKIAWTDNPAWCFYDLITENRYGLGEFIDETQVDKWQLYSIAQYCDQLVDDGFGGTEPRFTCNLYLQTAGEAYTVLSNMASIFRGMLYWINGTIAVVQDAPGDPVALFTQANVAGGEFHYEGSSRRARHTVALVSWNDPADFYQQKVEYVEDAAGIARYGIVSSGVVAFGCTSRGQARRLGLFILYTERLQTETVTFQAGLDATGVYPGALINILDAHRAGMRFAGRVLAATTTTLTVDEWPDEPIGTSPFITVVLPDGSLEERAVASVSGNVVTPGTAFSAAPLPMSNWVLSTDSLAPTVWRVVAISDSALNTYDITALLHDGTKFAAIEEGLQLQPPPPIYIPPSTIDPPTGLTFTETVVTTPLGAERRLRIAWVAPLPESVADHYVVEWQFESGIMYRAEVGGTVYEIPSQAGNYLVNVYSVNRQGVVSASALTGTYFVQDTSPLGAARVTGLELYGQDLDTVFTGKDAAFAWRYNAAASSHDIGSEPYGANSGSTDPTFKDFEVAIYDVTNASRPVRVEHTLDTHWTYTYDENVEDGHGTPRYTFTIGVKVRDKFNANSAEARLTVINNAPDPPSNIEVFPGQGLLSVSCTPVASVDGNDIVIYASVTSGFTPSNSGRFPDVDGAIAYQGPGPIGIVQGLAAGTPIYLRLASKDAFRIGTPLVTEFSGTPAADLASPASIVQSLNEYIAGVPDDDKLVNRTDTFLIRSASDADFYPFILSEFPEASGNFVLAISADTIINGSLSVTNLTSGQLPTDTSVNVGGTVFIDGNGSITIYKDVGANQDFVLLAAADVQLWQYVDTTYRRTKSLRSQPYAGSAVNGQTVTLPDYYDTKPTVFCSPMVAPVFKQSLASQDQQLRCQALNIREDPSNPGSWSFDAQMLLEILAGSGNTPVGVGSGDITASSYTSATVTTDTNVRSVHPHIRLRTKRCGGGTWWAVRQYRWRIDYKLHSASTFTAGTFTAWKNYGQILDVDLLDDMTTDFGSGDVWDFQIVIEWQNKVSGVYVLGADSFFLGPNGGGVETKTASDIHSHVAGTQVIGATQTVSASFSAASGSGQITHVNYSWTHRWTHDFVLLGVHSINGNSYGRGVQLASPGYYQLSHPDQTAGAFGGPIAKSYALTGTGTFNTSLIYVQSTIPTSGPFIGSGTITRDDYVEDIVANVYHMQTERNRFTLDSFDFNYAVANVPVDGTLQFVAVA